jgi:hypothetical protein
MIKHYIQFAVFPLFALLLTACSKDDTDDNPPSQNVTRWECILFGSYPANEVVSGSFNAVDDYALVDGDVIVDAALYSQLEHAQWTNDDTEIDGRRYHRLNAAGAVSHSDNSPQHYRWTDADAWHYFAYASIKWRILKQTGDNAVLLADRMPDTCPFHDKDEDVNWSGCHLRQWLNSDFLHRAFSETERNAIETTSVENAPNSSYGTNCGPDTQDRVFILSNKEVFASPLATDYGFYAGSGIDDAARRFRSTLYAKCRGAWWSSVTGYRGNSFWFMRTNGYTPSNITYICDFGYLYNQGTAVTCDDAAMLPALTIDLTKASWTVATPVKSTDIVR